MYYSYRKRARRLPLRRENLETNFVNIHILVLVYVECCQRGQALLTHSASKRGFQSLHAAKTVFGSAGWHRIGYWAKWQERHTPLGRTGGLCDLVSGPPELCFFLFLHFIIPFLEAKIATKNHALLSQIENSKTLKNLFKIIWFNAVNGVFDWKQGWPMVYLLWSRWVVEGHTKTGQVSNIT